MNEHDDMQLKRDLDALPREIAPPADLWPGVRGRLRDRGTVGHRDGTDRRPVPLSRRPTLRVAALLALLGLSAGALMISRQRAATWRVVGRDSSGTLRPGEYLATGGTARILTVGTIGRVEADTATRLHLVRASATEQRMALDRGTIRATISAPPRLFIVETPSGTAADMGCAYTLTVDSGGNSRLAVTAGWVSFEDRGVTSLIPAGMTALARRGAGIGTPVMDDASDSLRGAVAAWDTTRSDSALSGVLRGARTRDAVTLWHMVQRGEGAQRGRIVTKLVAMVPLPDGVTRAAIDRANPRAMELYWIALPGTLPIVPSWQQGLWRLWLRISG